MPEASTWPDWTGRDVAIIASGPSAKKVDIDLLRGRFVVIAIKRNVELAPWADVVYGCDLGWWASVEGLPDFQGLKLAYADRACDQYGCRKLRITVNSDKLLFDETGHVGSGGNSGFHALNWAVQLGARRVLLIGFDMHGKAGVHWYGRNTAAGMSNPSEDNYRRWREAFITAAPVLAERGVEVINASPLSALKCFPRSDVQDALKEWGIA